MGYNSGSNPFMYEHDYHWIVWHKVLLLNLTITITKCEDKKSFNAFLHEKVKIIFDLFWKQYKKRKKDHIQVHVIDARMA